jgi:hypothetical protein
MKIINIAAIICSLAISCMADELVASYTEAAKLGDAQEQAAATSDYFAHTLIPYYEQKYGPALQLCFASLPHPDSRAFSFVVAIGSDGRVMKMYMDHETTVSRCLQKKIELDQFPKPPEVPYYLHIDMQFSGDPEPAVQPTAETYPETGNDDIKASAKSCSIIRMTLAARERERESGDVPEDDDFTDAGRACTHLNAAIASSDQRKIEEATLALRPILARLALPPTTPREQLSASEKKASRLNGLELFYELPNLSKQAFDAGEVDKAKRYATQLLQTAPQYPQDWNYGNAIFYGNLVLGRVSVKRKDFAAAGRYLLAAGATPGSPQLDSFGPNMSLAKELVENGHADVVLRYLGICRKFWQSDNGRLDEWGAAIREGRTPEFGSNLRY